MLKKFLVGLGAVVVVLFAAFQYMTYSTKKASPEVNSTYNVAGTQIDVFYCSPRKKGRDIFPDLVPFGEVWRTGANEATTFTHSADVDIEGETLKAGSYSVWTIPGENEWEIIFNSEIPGWGVSWGAKAARNPETDVLSVRVPAMVNNENIQEEFLIEIKNQALRISWDDMLVEASISTP